MVLKRRGSAVVQASPNGPAILIYGGAEALKEGIRYDLAVLKLKHYYKIPEIGDFEILKEKEYVNINSYILPFKPSMLKDINYRYRVVRDIEGVYRHYRLIVDKTPIKLYFKNRRWRAKTGDKLKIKIAQIGYYRGESELIIWSRKDFKKVRK